MTVVRRLARPMLAAMFVDGGLDALRHPSAQLAKARAGGPQARRAAAACPDDPELLVRANGAAMVGAGALLATGRLPRLRAAGPGRVPRADDLRGPRVLGGDRPGQQARRSSIALPEEPRPARRPAARRGRHRGQARAAVAGPPRRQGRPRAPPAPAKREAKHGRRPPRPSARREAAWRASHAHDAAHLIARARRPHATVRTPAVTAPADWPAPRAPRPGRRHRLAARAASR